jgi:hypothetical protein
MHWVNHKIGHWYQTGCQVSSRIRFQFAVHIWYWIRNAIGKSTKAVSGANREHVRKIGLLVGRGLH